MITMATLFVLAQATATGSMMGRVTDSVTHQPIRSALVTANGMRDVTGNDGSYTVKGLAPGDVQVRVACVGYRELETKTSVAAGDLLKRDFELHPLARITGKVVDKDTGEPILRAVFVRRRGNAFVSPPGRMSPDGGFRIGSLEPGDYTLEVDGIDDATLRFNAAVEAEPKKPRRSYGEAVYPAPIHLEEGEERFVDLRLPALAAHSVAGTIEVPSGSEGEPLFLSFQFGSDGATIHTVSKRGGTFRIDGLTRGEYALGAAVGEGSGRYFGRLLIPVTDHDVDELKLVLTPSASLTGSVQMVEEDAAVPARLQVALVPASGWANVFSPPPIHLQEGRFHADAIAPDDYWLELNGLPDGYAVMRTGDRAITLNGHREITFLVTSKAGAIVGAVRDKNQVPLKGARVELVPDSFTVGSDPRLKRRVDAGDGGQFRFVNVAPGKYRVNGLLVEVQSGQTVNVAALQ